MRKFINLVAFAALLFIPSLAKSQCTDYTSVPYSTGFEDLSTGGLPSCWVAYQTSAGYEGTTFPCAYAYAGNARNSSVYLEFETHSGQNEILALPLMENISTLKLTFWASAMSSYLPVRFEVGVLEETATDTTFVPVDTITFTTSSNWSTGYHQYTVYFANYTGSGERIAMRATGNGSGQYTLMMDDFTIDEFSGCYPLSSLTATDIDSASMTLQWSDPLNSYASYTLSYWTTNGDTTEITNISTTSYLLTDLTPLTIYHFMVTPNCGSGDGTPATATFSTSCGAATLPFTEDFENASSMDCWTVANIGSSSRSTSSPISGTASFRFYYTTNPPQYLISPQLVGTDNGAVVEFDYNEYSSAYGDETFHVGYSTTNNDTASFTWGPQITASTSIQSYSSTVPNGTKYIAIKYTAYNAYYLYIDNIHVFEDNGCSKPNVASSSNVTAHTADLVWSSVGSASGYVVTYGTVNDATDSDNITVTTNDTAYTLTGLDGQTTYYVWVATDCGGTTSDMRSFSPFTTLISCPGVTGLTVDTTTADGATISWHSGGTETAWLVAIDSNEFETVYDSTYTISGLDAMTGHTVYVRADCGGDDGLSIVNSVNFATRCADATCLLTAYVTDSYDDSWNNGYINVVQAGVTVATIDCPYNQSGSTFTYEVCSTAPVSLVLGDRGTYPSEMGGTISDGSGAVVFTITNMSSYSNGETLATVATPCPECIMPMNLTLDTNYAVTASEATITWDAGEGSAWFVVLGTDTFSVSSNTYTFTNLDARTQYTAYVATDCSGDTSAYNSFTFTTDCATGSCNITVEMVDSYGDGWSGYDNDSKLKFYQNGAEVGEAYLANGNNGTATVSVCSGIPVTYNWQSGDYDNECSYIIYDGAGTEVYNSANGGVNHSDSILNACPSCLQPTGVHASAIDSVSITFEWNEVDSVAGYLVSFNGGAYTDGYNGTETYSGLASNTEYTFSVKAVCVAGANGTGDTSSARTITVRTACGLMAVPFTEDFESEATGNMPSCWTLVNTTGYSGYPGISNSGYNSSHALTLAANYNDSALVATSAVPLPGDSIKVSFWASINNGNTLQAGVMTSLADDTTFIPLLTLPSNNATYTLYEFNTSTLNQYETYYVAFRLLTGGSNHYADIDDINIRQNDGCLHPSNLVATVSGTTVDLTWSYSGTLPSFTIEYRAFGNTTWTPGASVIDTLANITGLATSTSYEIRVGAICGNDTLWTTTTIQTPCGLMPLPYSEDFDAYATDVMPPCWEWSSTSVTHADGGVFFRSYHGGGSEYVVLPQVDGVIAKLKIEFDTKVGTPAENDGILVGVADANGTLLAWLDTLQDPNFSRNNHVRKTVYFPSYIMPAGAARVAFAQYRNWYEWALIDNINIEELPDCYPVDNLVGHNLDDIENTTFTWHPVGTEDQWQVYVDTVTVGIDSIYHLPDSLFTTVYDTSYTLPIGAVQGGGIYNFFVRAHCNPQLSTWVKLEFGAGTIIMDQTTDTVTGCGFVVYDNGGPIAGYLGNSNNELVIRTENAGSQPQIFGAKFGFGSSPATLTVYDGEGTSGTVLYTYNTVNGRDTLLNTILATSTTGSLTITFSVSGTMCHTGYELYVRCTDGAICPRPTELQAEMTSPSTATATWSGTASNYNFYYRLAGNANTWVRMPVSTNSVNLTGLTADTVYDMYVVALCSATDSSSASVMRQLRTHFELPQPDQYTVTILSANAVMGSATADHTGSVDEGTVVTATATANDGYHFVNWTSNGSVVSTDNPYTFTLTADITLTANFEQDDTPGPQGIDDVDGNAIALFPNPASTTVTLSGLSGMEQVAIVDMNGREVYRVQANHQSLTIDLTGFAQGAYFVRITGEQQTAIRKLIVK